MTRTETAVTVAAWGASGVAWTAVFAQALSLRPLRVPRIEALDLRVKVIDSVQPTHVEFAAHGSPLVLRGRVLATHKAWPGRPAPTGKWRP